MKFVVPQSQAPFQVIKRSDQKFVVPENAPPSGPTGAQQ